MFKQKLTHVNYTKKVEVKKKEREGTRNWNPLVWMHRKPIKSPKLETIICLQRTWCNPCQSLWAHSSFAHGDLESCFLDVIHPLWLLNFRLPLSKRLPEPCKQGFDEAISFRLGVLRSPTLCIMPGCGSLFLFSARCFLDAFIYLVFHTTL